MRHKKQILESTSEVCFVRVEGEINVLNVGESEIILNHHPPCSGTSIGENCSSVKLCIVLTEKAVLNNDFRFICKLGIDGTTIRFGLIFGEE
jgi:hypothetical protein